MTSRTLRPRSRLVYSVSPICPPDRSRQTVAKGSKVVVKFDQAGQKRHAAAVYPVHALEGRLAPPAEIDCEMPV